MDLTKAQYLLLKIQTFLDVGDGNELSRLEKDLMKSYIVQLYDAVITDDDSGTKATFNQMEDHDTDPAPEPPPAPAAAPINDTIVKEKPTITPSYQAPEPEPRVEQPAPEPTVVVENLSQKEDQPEEVPSDELVRLFEHNHPEKMDSRFRHVPIDDIASALGLNERIFTLNVLFGGDRELFDNTCEKLNQLNSFTEASALLLNGVARKYNWADRESMKMAEHFIRTIARKYPNT